MRKPVIALLVLGLMQMSGDLFCLPVIKALATATAASPAPKVFSSVRGLETFSTRFFVQWHDSEGTAHSVEITPERAAGLRGPYNRRNIFGAVLAYGPILESNPRTRPMFASVSHYALCADAPMLVELGINPKDMSDYPVIRLLPRAGSKTGDLPLTIEVKCQ